MTRVTSRICARRSREKRQYSIKIRIPQATSRGVRALISAMYNGGAKRKSQDAAPRGISTRDQVYPGTGAIRLGPSVEC